MEDSIELAVKRAIATMRDNLGEQITVDDMARAAMFSKFHFTRIFQRVTGVSPGRFLSALRLQQAQHLLVSTSLNVADISQRVGYNSVGTFSSRFSRSVGMSPTAYRRRAGFASHIPTSANRNVSPSTAQIHGKVLPHGDGEDRLIFAGLFPERIPQGQPAQCLVKTGPGPFVLDRVPQGSWHLLAQSVPGNLTDTDGYQANVNEAVSVASFGPVTVRQGTRLHAELHFNPVRVLDPPVLLALLDVRKLAMTLVRERSASVETTSATQQTSHGRPHYTSDRSAA
ncbi:AraC family transcriptional regulator [Micromonospora sediminicola]|uniref:AraC family transcriptional regulator n=1 Tax=Micromonospora sediminicola TaxID=946078 RepID=UPI0034079BA3